ncbi:DNA-directed RNA polymerase, putative [Medicago truncatula]|uniref:DNA-directed RNA polymerase, putative n=1 Tax=Medicago truncatula TaxID=3880 RepID=G7IXW7_MEDTR|nr:DNA-directed RNA polymerase, putative [Medicago truncatula]
MALDKKFKVKGLYGKLKMKIELNDELKRKRKLILVDLGGQDHLTREGSKPRSSSQMRGNPYVRFSNGEIHLIRSYPNFSFARPVVKKPTLLRLRGSFEYEIQSWKYSTPLFFAT